MQEGHNRSRSCQAPIEMKPKNFDGQRIYQGCVEQTESTRFWLDGLTYLSRRCRGQTQKS